MRPGHFERAKEVLATALGLPAERRASYLDEACAGDAALRAEVDSLLAHEVDTPSLLDTGGLGGAVWSDVLAAIAPERLEPSGRRIGPYELIAVLGEGGMGTVYHARQTEPIARDVALKLIKRGLDTSRVVARFEAERQTLARLDHPAIARILDAGADDQGRPYFVMELVRGVPITDYADARRLSVRDRLALFLQVCQAVQHAHQKGVLHRDLKPSNILVTEHDGVALPKVIDFGVARAIEDTAGGESMLTEAGQLVGTPEYMSPEQAGVRPGGTDTRSDVYSLGVVLYELLTGQRPLRLRGLRVAEIQRIIGTEEPTRPSGLVTTMPAQAAGVAGPDSRAIGTARQTSPSRLGRLLAGDLDNIVLMCLRKEPERRYPGVEQLADDLRRYLQGRPVTAQRDTWRYRAGKFTRRHRVAVGAAAAALIALVAFAGVMTWERNQARQAEARARAEAETAQQVSDFLVGLFQHADPFVAQGDTLTARDLLDQGADRITRDLAGQPKIQAALMATMSQAYTGLQVPDRAVSLAQQSLALARQVYGPRDPAVATALLALAAAHASQSDQQKALPLYREALAMRKALLPPDDPAIVEATSLLALDLQTLARFDEAESLYREALAITRRSRPPDDPAITAALDNLGGVLHGEGKVDEARQVLEDALARARQGHDPELTADILSELAVLLKNTNHPDEAEPMYKEALDLRERTFGPDHPMTGQSENNYGVFLRGIGRAAEALPHLERSLAIDRAHFGEKHLDVGIAYANLASVYGSLDRFDDAEAAYKSALASIAGSMGRKYWVYGQTQYNYGELLRHRGRMAAAEPLLVQGYQRVRDGLGQDARRTQLILKGLVDFYDAWKRPKQAAEYRALLTAGEDGAGG
jgi:eukaryotic-like serine/threonine-protein kinase